MENNMQYVYRISNIYIYYMYVIDLYCYISFVVLYINDINISTYILIFTVYKMENGWF